MEWSGVEWSGVEWSGVEWSGVEWSGVEWSGVEWSGDEIRLFQAIVVHCRSITIKINDAVKPRTGPDIYKGRLIFLFCLEKRPRDVSSGPLPPPRETSSSKMII